MQGTRVVFDSSSPIVVASFDLVVGPKRFKRGDALPWRDLGVSEYDLLQLYLAQQVDCSSPPSVAPAALPAATAQATEAAVVPLEAFEAAARQLATEAPIAVKVTPVIAEVLEQVRATVHVTPSRGDRRGRRS